MTLRPLVNKSKPEDKSAGIRIFENILLGLVLCVLALRVTIAEGLAMQSSGINMNDSLYSLSISVLLISALAVLLAVKVLKGGFYRWSGLEIGFGLFIAATIVSIFFASDKRAAISYTIIFAAPILTAVLLVQLLDRPWRIRMVFIVIAALGFLSTYKASEQVSGENEVMIEEYEANPETFLEPLNIEKGSFQQMLFEHRLYSSDVKAFFTTSNSAGSFAILAGFAALALLLERIYRKNKTGQGKPVQLFVVCAVIFAGLVMTTSKGAIGGALIAGGLLGIWYYRRNLLARHKLMSTLLVLLTFSVGLTAIILYAISGRDLPGGNSMLVRWEYWLGAARMWADNLFFGVGPGNFGQSYIQYKLPQSLEAVVDPHNFPLSILAQFGTLGFIGLAVAFVVPVYNLIFKSGSDEKLLSNGNVGNGIYTGYFAAVIFTLVVVRSFFVIGNNQDAPAAFLILIALPAGAFSIGYWLVRAGENGKTFVDVSIVKACLFCGIVGFLIHNLVDYAIFEPPVHTTFWALFAVLIAVDRTGAKDRRIKLKTAGPIRAIAVVGVISSVVLVGIIGLLPVAKTLSHISNAQKAYLVDLQKVESSISRAVDADRLNPLPAKFGGGVYLHLFQNDQISRKDHLKKAETLFKTAIGRNPGDFKNHERLSDVYILMSQTGWDEKESIESALASTEKAVELYPGLGSLAFKAARLADRLGLQEKAAGYYRRAVEIEDSYRVRFEKMYPGTELFSRLGNDKYLYAKSRVEQLGSAD